MHTVIPIFPFVTDNGFWMYVHEALSAVYQAEAFEWELHGFWPICSDFLHNCCLMISLQIPEDGVRID